MKSTQHQNKTPAALPDLKEGASRGSKVTLPDETGGAFVDHTNHARKETVIDACKK